jgi:hypothetical protein
MAIERYEMILYSSVSDRIRIRILLGWIRIQEGKKDPQNLKKLRKKKFHVLMCWMFSF